MANKSTRTPRTGHSRPTLVNTASETTRPPTPRDVQLELAARAMSRAIEAFVRLAMNDVVANDEWVCQESSPLGARRHLAAVRRGDLPGTKVGKKVLVRKSDLESFLRERTLTAASRETTIANDDGVHEERLEERLLSELGLRKRRD